MGPRGPDYIVAEDGCWLWAKSLFHNGYGRINRGGHDYAHRFYYAERHGEIVGELHHTCGVRRCVNPDHLEPLTRLDHMHVDRVKWPTETVALVRSLRMEGKTYTQISRITGVPTGTMDDWFSRRWRKDK